MKTSRCIQGVIALALLGMYPSQLLAGNQNTNKPNVLMIFYDDMGYSDVGIYGDADPSLTPNLDTFASDALRFTAGHSADAVCTPSRYALMTGRYCWRTDLKGGVNGGYSPSLIEPERFTFARMFQSLGYTTAMVGKWHIGMQFHDSNGQPVGDLNNNNNVLDDNDATTSGDLIDFSLAISNTPYHNGFDYYFGTTASLDMPPYAWIENDHLLFKGGFVTNGMVDFSQGVPATNADLEEGTPNSTANTSGNVRGGVYDPYFIMQDYLQVQAAKVAELLQARGADNEPFFIYVPMPAPHSPWMLQDQFVGATSYHYGDYMAQTDHYTGQILQALEDPDGNPLTDDSMVSNTVVFITSDNGPEKFAQAASLGAGYDGNGDFRGVKRDNWEGGTRVPFMVRWPGVTIPGITDHFCWQGDFYAAMAEHLKYDFSPEEVPDAESILPILIGEDMPEARREGVVQHSMNGQLAVIDQNGEWKLLDGTGSGGYNDTYDADNVLIGSAEGVVLGSPKQLFNLHSDPGERTNLLINASQAHEDKEAELYALLNKIRGDDSYGTDGDSNVPFFDTDLDGIPNYYENTTTGLDRLDPADAELDFDSDGLSNLEEFQCTTDPHKPDTDNDLLSDFDEINRYETSPIDDDSDNDSISDGNEILQWDTDPALSDTDEDGYPDAEELSYFSNPRSASSIPARSTVEMEELELSPSVVQAVGSTGTAFAPADVGGAAGAWPAAGTLYVRERSTNGSRQQTRTQLFLKFDVESVLANIQSARLRIHQNNRLNDIHTGNIQMARVTQDWDNTSGTNYPLFASTSIADAFIFGSNADFGMATDASGFFGGAAGTPATDDSGFDPSGLISSMVSNWANGTLPNYGIRLAFPDRGLTGSAFSDADDPATTNVNENLQLIVTTYARITNDSDGDQLDDAYEMAVFSNLVQSGSADFDGDGVNNLIEQALGSDPTLPDSRPVQAILLNDANEVTFSYHRYLKGGLGYEVKVSENFVQWVSADVYYKSPVSSVAASELGADYEKVLLEPAGDMPQHLYIRILVHTP
ncbi:sulfatase-like hydrolase/transferase [Pontiellaceae bacterium B1224]|nr:sulfatase-like hydrolase/transferase [Pontiellaceae bacterium B1224]